MKKSQNGTKAMKELAIIVDQLLELNDDNGNEAPKAHALLQKVGIYNYKTGLLLETDWLNEELALRKLKGGGPAAAAKEHGPVRRRAARSDAAHLQRPAHLR